MAQNQFINVTVDAGASKKVDQTDHKHTVTNGGASAGDLTVSWDSTKFTNRTMIKSALQTILTQLQGQIGLVLIVGLVLSLFFAPAPARAQVGNPGAGVQVTASSGNVAAATATATLAAALGKVTYICGFSITSAGSTAAAVVSPTIANIVTGTMTFTYATVVGVTLANAPLVIAFNPCISGSTPNTAVAVSMPSLGAGNTNTTVSAWGFQR
jgi:hypothetical protein